MPASSSRSATWSWSKSSKRFSTVNLKGLRVYRVMGYIRRMENKMETTIMGYILGLYWGYILGIMGFWPLAPVGCRA